MRRRSEMSRPRIALAVSQHFEAVYPALKDIVGALVLRDLAKNPGIAGHALTGHLNGFIDDGYDRAVTPEFFRSAAAAGLELLSTDLGPACRKVEMKHFYEPASPVLSPEEILKIGRERVAHIRRNFKGTLSLENLDYHPGGAYDHVCEPDFIKKALAEWDVGLTLDIGHLNVTCFQMGMKPEEFLDRIPLERLKEIHVSHANGGDDSHAPPEESDIELLKAILARSRPDFVTLEFYWDPEIIIRETRRLHEAVSASPAMAS